MSSARRTRIVASWATFVLASLAATPAGAGGLYLSEFGTVDMGAAGSGELARAGDASTAIVNPAGMTYLDSHQFDFGLAPGYGVVRFDQDSDSRNFPDNNGGNQGGLVPVVSSAYVHKISDRLRAGLGIFSISGASLDPDNDWTGRNQVQSISLFTLTFQPTAALRVTDWLSLGAGPAITYATLDWKLSLPGPGETPVHFNSLHDWGVAAMVGAVVEPCQDVRVGVVYQSETKLTLDGNTKIGNASAPTKIKLPLPHAVRMDVRWQATDALAFSAGWDWEDWSALQHTLIDLGPTDGSIKLGFKDTWKLRGGVHYRINEQWLAQTGVSYDSSALNTSDRTAALPIDEQWRWGIGGVYRWSESTNVGFGFEYLNLGRGSTNSQGPMGVEGLHGHYKDNQIFFFMVNLNFAKLPWDGMASF